MGEGCCARRFCGRSTGGWETLRRRAGPRSGRRRRMAMTTVTPFCVSMKESRAQLMCPQSLSYDNSPAHRYPPRRTPTWTFPVPCSHPRDPMFVHPQLFWWGNTNPSCSRTHDSPVVVRRPHLPLRPRRRRRQGFDSFPSLFPVRSDSIRPRDPPKSMQRLPFQQTTPPTVPTAD